MRRLSDIEPHDPAGEILWAAKKAIECNLEMPDLSPSVIARIVGVSLRTLHRSFSGSGSSVMSFVRHRRLLRAHDDLVRRGSATGISEIAARWHFSDSSHFIRHFKSAFGVTPAAYLKTHCSPHVANSPYMVTK